MNTFIDNAKVMAKGQVTIPKDVRKVLGVNNGDRITFIVDNGNVKVVNSAVYAMEVFQKEMRNEASKSDLKNDEDIVKLVKDIRNED